MGSPWQSLGRGPGVYDLAYLLGGSVTLEVRRTHEDSFLHAYHDRLVAHGVADYSFEDLVADYRLAGSVMAMTHTLVPQALEGRGIAAALVAQALAHARSEGWRVRPVCSYVESYMRRHPETLDLLAA